MAIKTRSQIITENNTDFPDNVTQLISPADLRGQMNDTADSALFAEDDLATSEVTSTGNVTKPLSEWVEDISGSGNFTYGTPGAITWPIATRMKQQVYLLDFIPLSEHAAILNDTSTYDCADAFEAAMATVSAHGDANERVYVGGPEVIFPYGTCQFSRTIEIKKTMILTGRGGGHRNHSSSTLNFPADITGITVNSLTGFEGDTDPPVLPIPPAPAEISKAGDATTIRNLRISSASGGVHNPALNDTGVGVGHGIGHGIWVRGACLIENCQVQWFPQHGIYVRASVNTSIDTPDQRAVFGNANLTQVYHTAILSNGGCGIYVDGPDTNACLFVACDIAGNEMSGIYESSLIGNTYIMPHTSDNGSAACCSYRTGPGLAGHGRYYARDPVRANGQALPRLPSTAYVMGDLCVNVRNLYRCIQAGTSSASVAGPILKLPLIVDGTVHWEYVFQERDDLYPHGAVARIPPGGHADSAVVWGYIQQGVQDPADPAYPNAEEHPGSQDVFPTWPYLADGVTYKQYRFGYNFWFDAESAGNTLIGPYSEGGQPLSLVTGPSVVIGGNERYDDWTTAGGLHGLTSGTRLRPTVQIPALPGATRDYLTILNRANPETLTFQVAGDGHVDAVSADQFGWVWDETNGCWMIQHARLNSRVPQRFTTGLNTLTGGRAAPIIGGNTMFTQGFWVGQNATYARHFSTGIVAPTTGQWAAGDLVLNAQPLQGEPWGWRCILTGDFAATPPVFQPLRDVGSQQSIDSVAFTLTPGTSPHHTRHIGTMTADRAVTLSTTGALIGLSYRIARTSAGAFNLNVGVGPLKALATNTWCEVIYDGTAYYLAAYGGLTTSDVDSLDTLTPASGGAVTQLTSKATGVTLNKISGQITTHNASLAANTSVSFTLTNSQIAAYDIVQTSIASGVPDGAYTVTVDAVAAGSCKISIYNRTIAARGDIIVINFGVIRGSIT